VWTGKTAVENTATELRDKVDEIGDLQDAITNGTGIKVDKDVARDAGAKTAWALAKAVKSLAIDNGDNTLAGEMDFSWSDLRYAKDQDTVDRWQLVHDRADDNSTALDTGGYVDITLIATLDTQLSAFKSSRPKPQAHIASNKALNREVKVQVKNMVKLKKELIDRLTQFALSNTTFYNTVLDAFEVDRIGVRHRAARLVYEDMATGVRLKGVKSNWVELEVTLKSSKRGIVDMKQADAEEGNYTIVSELKDYTTNTQSNFAVEAGKSKRVVIKMVKM
jgi:hypothetical protein